MKYTVMITNEAKEDLAKLDKVSRNKVFADYDSISNVSIQTVDKKKLEKDLYEIKTDNIRSLYNYQEGKIIIIAVVFIKKTQKTPDKYKQRAKNILSKY